LEVEKIHEKLYRSALDTLDKKEGEFEYYICPICGFTHERSAPDKCPVCGAAGSKFFVVK
jgi:rubrerythrin